MQYITAVDNITLRSKISLPLYRTPDLLLNRAAVLAANATSAFCEYYESIALSTLLKKK